MNKSVMGYVLGVAIVFLCVHQGYSLHCWKCNSKFDPRCGETEFDPSTLSDVDCNQLPESNRMENEAIYCRKIIQRVKENVRTVRGCGWLKETKVPPGECYTRTGTKDIMVTYCHCDTDNCNGASSFVASLGLATFVLAITRLF